MLVEQMPNYLNRKQGTIAVASLKAVAKLVCPPDPLTPSLPRRFGARSVHAPTDHPSLAQAPSRLPARPPSTQTSLPHPRRKMLAMWPVRVAWLSQLTCQRKVVSCRFVGAGRRDDEEVLKNKSFIDRSLYRTVRSDQQHSPNTIIRCAYDLAGSG